MTNLDSYSFSLGAESTGSLLSAATGHVTEQGVTAQQLP
jgi:hypothetical protein